jgi:hypothetical protein
MLMVEPPPRAFDGKPEYDIAENSPGLWRVQEAADRGSALFVYLKRRLEAINAA